MSTTACEAPLDERRGTIDKLQPRKRHHFPELISQSQLDLQSHGKNRAHELVDFGDAPVVRDVKIFLDVTSMESVLSMTINLAKARRLEALNTKNADRILVKPAAHYSQVKMPDEGTVAEYLIEALFYGVDLSELASETGWSRSTVLVNLYKVAKKTGVGVRRREDVLRIILPKGCEQHNIKPKTVSLRFKIRDMASEVVIPAAVNNM